MAQISRPFQIALAAVVVLAGVALFVLHGRSSSPSSTPSVSAPATSSSTATGSHATASTTAGSGSTHIYHGSAPGVEGLTRAIAKAHQAVTATGDAPQQPSSSTKPSAPAATATKTSSPAASSPAASSPAASSPSASKPSASSSSASKPSASSAQPSSPKTSTTTKSSTSPSLRQTTVEADLKAGIPVVLLFWNPKGTEDALDHNALVQLVRNDIHAHRLVAVQDATASQVAEFGSITRGVQIGATPTILVISPHDQAISLTGVQDAFSIEQAIEEALHPNSQS